MAGKHHSTKEPGVLPLIDIKKAATEAQKNVDNLVAAAGKVLLDKENALRVATVCMITRGHLLIEDLPGVGKTIMAHLMAKLWGLDFQRVQFTNDLLPADILGYSLYNKNTGEFTLHKGPIFSQVLLADEINRSPPKSQSALLEAMEEKQVTLEGKAMTLPDPFFVIATQNPASQIGTYPLPESQLDRFTLSITLGYPAAEAEKELLNGRDRRHMLKEIQPVLSPEYLRQLQKYVPLVRASDALLNYLQAFLHHTRQKFTQQGGLSPRAGVLILNSARAWALTQGRAYVVPDDLQAVLPHAVCHRLFARDPSAGNATEAFLHSANDLITQVSVP